MAYPFVRGPTVREFVDRAIADHGCEMKELREKVQGPKGEMEFKYLVRGSRFTEPLPSDFSEHLGPDSLRRLCKQLGLPITAFGLPMG